MTIPDDVMKAADYWRGHLDTMIRSVHGGSGWLPEEANILIARAIMAERERCAEEAEDFGGAMGEAVAAAIRRAE